jgi:Resolvase, N terminal domain
VSTSERIPRVALYARVSSEEQVERETIEAQRAFLKDYARLHGLNVVGEFSDIYINGRRKGRRETPYYRCRMQSVPARLRDGQPCRAAMVRTSDVERIVWKKVYDLIVDPRRAIDTWQQHLEARHVKSEEVNAKQQQINRALMAKATERDRVFTLFRRRLMTFDEAEAHLEVVEKETVELQSHLATYAAQEEVLNAGRENYQTTVELLKQYRAGLKAIEAADNPNKKRDHSTLAAPYRSGDIWRGSEENSGVPSILPVGGLCSLSRG